MTTDQTYADAPALIEAAETQRRVGAATFAAAFRQEELRLTELLRRESYAVASLLKKVGVPGDVTALRSRGRGLPAWYLMELPAIRGVSRHTEALALKPSGSIISGVLQRAGLGALPTINGSPIYAVDAGSNRVIDIAPDRTGNPHLARRALAVRLIRNALPVPDISVD